jgi:hypothetical protein
MNTGYTNQKLNPESFIRLGAIAMMAHGIRISQMEPPIGIHLDWKIAKRDVQWKRILQMAPLAVSFRLEIMIACCRRAATLARPMFILHTRWSILGQMA